MSLDALAQYFDPYPSLAVFPLGKKTKSVRSPGHKKERAVFGRMEECLQELDMKEPERQALQGFFGLGGSAVFPVFSKKGDELYPHFIRPESVLWKEFSSQHGVPLHPEGFYPESFASLSRDALFAHVKETVRDYLFAAYISKKSRGEWEKFLEESYYKHPFVQLAHEKKRVIEAAEKMNRSSLLSLLSPPEDVSFWRKRIEIVLRPYRLLPPLCSHQKEMSLHSETETMVFSCAECKTKLIYHVKESVLELEEEPDMEKAKKRIATIERLFNGLAAKNTGLLEDLDKVMDWKKRLIKLPKVMEMMEKLYAKPFLEKEADPFSAFLKHLHQTAAPETRDPSELLWLSGFVISPLSLLKEIRQTTFKETEARLELLEVELENALTAEVLPPEKTILAIKQSTLSFQDLTVILTGLEAELQNQPLHLLAQVLKGRTSSKIREEKLDETEQFGYLQHWEEKDIQKAFKKLEKESLIKKQNVGYRSNIPE
ncbi:hypothetical protein LRR81_14315 [Metabacillus sp. GX 13764]|uniref:RQC-minor-2 family DNA-binding protein n=1 Tax=Metabacillus kandeliae TaxID=2900151 RepID=UPI001E552EAE|nr:RQC-minor-2 family DNA-binding protein [Metabacillus kandeliae]MCD7035416.1 hypothetical protein [Metabacillus kandeliae]